MTRFLWLVPFVVACSGDVDPDVEPVSDTYKLLECGALPDPATCVESDRRFDDDGCPALLCDGWPESPWEPEDAFQVVYCDGVRGVVGSVNGEMLCEDRWKE